MYVKVDENGEYGFYTTEIHGEEFCKDNCLKITDECYEGKLQTVGKLKICNNCLQDISSKTNDIRTNGGEIQ